MAWTDKEKGVYKILYAHIRKGDESIFSNSSGSALESSDKNDECLARRRNQERRLTQFGRESQQFNLPHFHCAEWLLCLILGPKTRKKKFCPSKLPVKTRGLLQRINVWVQWLEIFAEKTARIYHRNIS